MKQIIIFTLTQGFSSSVISPYCSCDENEQKLLTPFCQLFFSIHLYIRNLIILAGLLSTITASFTESLGCPIESYVSMGNRKTLKCLWSALCQECPKFNRESGTASDCESLISYQDLDMNRKQWMELIVLLTEDTYTLKNPVL